MATVEVRVRWPDEARSAELMVAGAWRRGPPRGALVMQRGETAIGVWRLPYDPELPGLAEASDPARLERLAPKLGIEATGVRPKLIAYRPGYQAVFRLQGSESAGYLKVLRPGRASALATRHDRLSGVLPVPHAYGHDDDSGALALSELPGKTLHSTLREPDAPIPPAESVLALIDRFGAVGSAGFNGRGRFGLARSARRHALALSALVPGTAPKLDRILEAVELADQGSSEEPGRTCHGDLHHGQILMSEGTVTGVVDLDRVGPGRWLDDAATLIASLAAAASGPGAPGVRAARWLDQLVAAVECRIDRAVLGPYVAGATLGVATGPFRRQVPEWPRRTEGLIDLALSWADRYVPFGGASGRNVSGASRMSPAGIG